jgi:hypothetical protein
LVLAVWRHPDPDRVQTPIENMKRKSVAEEFRERYDSAHLRAHAGDLKAVENMRAAIWAAAKARGLGDASLARFTDGSTQNPKTSLH